jgi:hypothetical protein
MALFQSTPYIIYSGTRFTNDNFGLAWGDIDGDGINELLVSPALGRPPVFLNYNGTSFETKTILVSDDWPNNLYTGFSIFDIDNDGKNEVIYNRQTGPGNMAVYKWHSDTNTLVKYSDISNTQNNFADAEISIAKINNQNYIFEAINAISIRIYSLSDYTAIPVHTIVNPIAGFNFEAGVDVRDIGCDGRFEMAISGGNAPGKRIKFLRLMDSTDITSWSDLNADLIIQNDVGFPESVVFANLDCPHRWDLVVTTSVGSNPADILVYRNITHSCPTCAILPTDPSTLEMLFRLFGFLIVFILFGWLFYDRNKL